MKRAGFALVCAALLAPVTEPAEGQTAPAADTASVSASALSKVPKQTEFVKAEYPPAAEAAGVETDVILLLDLDAEGRVTAVGVNEPSPFPEYGFDEAAIVAALRFRFEPAELDGKPIAVQITYRYKFRLTPAVPATRTTTTATATTTETATVAAPAPRTINFAGVLRERGTRTPLTGVLVTVFRDDGPAPIGFEATSNAEGRFEFYDLAPGDWKLLIESPGYYPFRTTETIAPGERTDVTYYVERASYNPYDVLVTAPKPKKEVSRTILSAKEIDKVPGTAGDPLAVVQNFAGVARTPAFSGQIVVRGSAPEDSRVFVDNAEIPLIYHFGGLRSVIPVGILENLKFYPGNFSPKYGRATGGIIDVELKELKPKRISGYADVSLLDTGLYLEAPLGDKGGLAIAGRRSYLDFILENAVPEDATVDLLTAPVYYDFQILGNYRPTPAHDFRAFFIYSDDRLQVLFDDPASLDPALRGNSFSSSTRFYRSLFTYRYVPSSRFENTAQISQGRNFINLTGGQLLFDLNFYTTQIRDTLRYGLTDWATLVVGADILFSAAQGKIRLPRPPKEGEPPRNLDLNDLITADLAPDSTWSPAGFVELELQPLEGLLLLPGVRVDYFERIEEAIVQPRVTARWALNDRWTVKGGAGLFAQEPTFEETSEDFGNPNLKSERAIHYSVGAEYRPKPYLTLDGTLFYKDLSHLVSQTDATFVDSGETRGRIYDNGGVGRVYGLEFVARHDFTNNFTGWFAYTLSRSERRDTGDREYRLFDFDQTHILSVVASYLLPKNWQIGMRFRYVTSSPTTPVIGSVFNASTDRYDPLYGFVNTERTGPFHQLDLRVDKRWVYDTWSLNFYLDLQNVYNRTNPNGLSYNYNFRESKPQAGLPILPILGLRAEF